MGWNEQAHNSGDGITMAYVLLGLSFDTLFYIFLAWAFDTDPLTGKYKITSCCKESNWSVTSLLYRKFQANNTMMETNEEYDNLIPHIEDNPYGRVLLDIKNLRKTYGHVVAIKDLNMQLYAGTLTVLLGQNGAGKTTMMSILAGLTQETAGSLVLSESCALDLKNRQLVSICPQEDLLFPELTVKEHLQFFGLLKGLTLKEMNTEIKKLLKDKLNLYEKRHELVKKLSGGMKRKLAIGIAVLGKPKILILDEPTAGIDPEGRRVIWDLISTLKGNTTILMSTHLMEEAEELAERVAIIDDGELECYGTPLYLKNKYNVGLHCTIHVPDESKDKFKKLIGSFSNNFDVVDDRPNLLVYNFDQSDKHCISNVMQVVENNKDEFSINDVSAFCLEDVFNKICKSKESRCKSSMANIETPTHHSISDNNNSEESCVVSFCKKLKIIATKKYFFLKNTIFKLIPIVAMFYLLVFLAFTLGDKPYRQVSQDGKTLKLQLDTYGSQDVYYSTSQTNLDLQRIYETMIAAMRSSAINIENVSERILERGEKNLAEFKTKLIVASEFITVDDAITHINVMYANQAIHGAPISLNLVTNALIKLYAGEEYAIIGSNTPLRSVTTKTQIKTQSLSDNILLWTTMLPLGALLPAMISLLLPTIERNNHVKTMSYIYNIKLSYWLSSYLLDFLIYLIIIAPVIIGIWIASLVGLLSLETIAIGPFLVIFMIYGITIIPVTYLISSFSRSVASACASFIVPNMCLSAILVGVVLTLEIGEAKSADLFRSLFSLNPHFMFSYLLSKFCMKMVENHNWDIKTQHEINTICHEESTPCCIRDSERCAADRAYIEWDLYMIWTIIAAFCSYLFVILWDSDCWKQMKKTPNKSVAILADRVEKVYKNFKIFGREIAAVKNLTFEVKKNDCYALLGLNGAGKSTTLRMITNQERPTNGTLNVTSKKIGYCPQEHAMIGDLTGRQMLRYFAHLQNHQTSENEINQLLEDCGLSQIADRLCKTYSGGNKRKLNTCIALIGNPEIIALDEPTTGVDPNSRLMIQELISRAKMSSGIIFTSHSMDECEKLCKNIAIIKKGEILKRKTIDELKEDYGEGYIIRIKLKDSLAGATDVKLDHTHIISILESEFSKENVKVLDDRKDIKIAFVRKATLIQLLIAMDPMKSDEKMGIDAYTLQKSSLEHLFLTIWDVLS